jgi:succinate dehydrogenase / fumarate reductase membrane anchor subunit
VKAYRKVPVGAHYGTGDWLLQRLTGLAMAVYTMVLVIGVTLARPQGYEEWRNVFTGPFMRLATMLFFLALVYHAWVGMRDILMDYLRVTSLRLAAQVFVVLVLAFYLAWAAAILWGR